MMTSIWGIALKTLRVKIMRTMFSVLAIALAVGLLIAMVLLMRQISHSLEQQLYVKYGGANLQVEYRPDHAGQVKTIGPETIEELYRSEYILAIEPVLNLSLFHEGQQDHFLSSPVTYYGVNDGPYVRARFQFQQTLHEGEVILTRLLAGRLEAEVGDTVGFPLESGRESQWRVAGIIDDLRSPDGTWQDQALFHLESVQRLIGLEGRVTQLIGQLTSDNEYLLASLLMNKDWNLDEELIIAPLDGLHDERRNITNLRWTGNVLAIVAFIISAVLLLGMLETSFREKLKDLAIIRSMGGSPEQIRLIALYESLIISVMGVAIGVGLGILTVRHGTDLFSRWLQVEMAELPVHVGLVIFVAAFALAALVAMSRIPANRVMQVDPIQSYREADYDEEKFDGLLRIVIWIGVTGVVVLLLSVILPEGSLLRVLLGLISGIILIIATLGMMFVTLRKLLRLIAAIFSAFGGRMSIIAVEQLATDRKQTAYIISVIGLTLSVFVTISTFMSTLLTHNIILINDRYATEIVVRSPVQNLQMMGLPAEVLDDIRQIPGVSVAIPFTFRTWTQLVDYDFSRSDKKWIRSNDQMSGARAAYEQLFYVQTDFQLLRDHQFLTIPDLPPNSAVIPKSYANNLGVAVGDVLRLKNGNTYTEVMIGGIVEQFLNVRPSCRCLYIDLHYTELQPTNEMNFETIFVIPGSSNYSEIINGLVALQRTYPELRWGERQGEIEQFTQQVNQRIGILWAVVGFVFIGGMMGMFNALSASIHARRREYAILRAIHLTPVQMAILAIYQSVIAAIIAVLLGLVGGATLFYAIYIGLGDPAVISVAWMHIGIIITSILGLSILVSLPMSIKLMRMSITKVFNSE